jgi:hypothetical protein
MKTKEEIEQLAIDYAKTQVVRGKNLPEWDDKTEQLIARYFTKGYNKCQEDMADKESQNKIKEHILNHANNQSSEDRLETELAAKKYTEEDVKWAVSMAIGKRDGGCGYTEIATTLEDKLLNKQDNENIYRNRKISL